MGGYAGLWAAILSTDILNTDKYDASCTGNFTYHVLFPVASSSLGPNSQICLIERKKGLFCEMADKYFLILSIYNIMVYQELIWLQEYTICLCILPIMSY